MVELIYHDFLGFRYRMNHSDFFGDVITEETCWRPFTSYLFTSGKTA